MPEYLRAVGSVKNEWGWSPPLPCCPVNHQCQWNETHIDKNAQFE